MNVDHPLPAPVPLHWPGGFASREASWSAAALRRFGRPPPDHWPRCLMAGLPAIPPAQEPHFAIGVRPSSGAATSASLPTRVGNVNRPLANPCPSVQGLNARILYSGNSFHEPGMVEGCGARRLPLERRSPTGLTHPMIPPLGTRLDFRSSKTGCQPALRSRFKVCEQFLKKQATAHEPCTLQPLESSENSAMADNSPSPGKEGRGEGGRILSPLTYLLVFPPRGRGERERVHAMQNELPSASVPGCADYHMECGGKQSATPPWRATLNRIRNRRHRGGAWHAACANVPQVSKPAVSPISQSADRPLPGVPVGRTAGGLGHPRDSRLGSLRYKNAVRCLPLYLKPMAACKVQRSAIPIRPMTTTRFNFPGCVALENSFYI